MPEAARVVTTDSEIDLAIKRAKQYEKYDRRVVKATFSRSTDKLRLILDDGATCAIPRRLIQGLSGAQKRLLKPIQILGGGTGLLWPRLDIAHSVPGLLNGVYGSSRWMERLNSDLRSRAKPPASALRSHAFRRKGQLVGIDSRQRDLDGAVREKSGNTLVSTLRKNYGEEFLSGWPGDTKLHSVRQETDMSLSEMVRQHRLGKRLPQPTHPRQ